jgi:hypothetical protein
MSDRNSTPEEIQACVAAVNLAWFRRQLDSGTEDFRHEVLEALIADEKHGFERKSLEGHPLV